jgi:CRISPR-associated protein Cas4
MLVSVTHLAAYLYCRRKLFLEQVLGFEEPPKESLVLGLTRHHVYDRLNKAEQEAVESIEGPIPFSGLLTHYERMCEPVVRQAIQENQSQLGNFAISTTDVFDKFWPDVCIELEERARNVHDFMSKHKVFGKELWQQLTPKFFSELRLHSQKYSLKGVIDKVAVFSEFCIPHEFKSGSAPRDGVWPGHRVQIAAYMIMLEEQFKPVDKGIVAYAGSQQRCEVRLNPFLRNEVLSLTSAVQSLLASKELPGHCSSPKKCSCCGLRQTCFDEPSLKKSMAQLKAVASHGNKSALQTEKSENKAKNP